MMTSSNGNIFRVTGHLCGVFPSQRPVTRSFDVYFDLRLNNWLSKQSWGWWFETLSCSLWRYRNVLQMKSLYMLNAYRNHLTDLPYLTGVGKTLKGAYFQSNKIIHIPTGSLSGMVVLESLNLGDNLIAFFPFEMIGSMPKLKSLHLAHNHLTTIPYLSHLPRKTGLVVNIYDNHIECTRNICWMRNYDKFVLMGETYLCRDHPVFAIYVFNDLTDDQMDCYCK